ncbi:MAG: hypothetical protein S4CHLAM7_00560 [Chlamydiae bacterium]|nr:hypothetical protein [Chlamydiota bacterium]
MVASTKSRKAYWKTFLWITLGAFIAAVAIKSIILPNNIIDGGVTGISMVLARIIGSRWLPYLILVINLPCIYLAYKNFGKGFLVFLITGIVLFSFFIFLLEDVIHNFPEFHGDALEVVVLGGIVLGLGIGIIIRNGGCSDGSEIIAIIVNRSKGFTIGQVVVFINIFIFVAAGYFYKEWNTSVRSFITYMVTYKTMDFVIVGLDEIKSVLIISSKPKELADTIMHKLGLGLTIMYGRGGYTGDDREILLVVVDRLQLSELKDIVLDIDPSSFMAVENLHEVVYGRQNYFNPTKINKKRKEIEEQTAEA